MAGARSATSRYTRIKDDLDQSIFNSNWFEIDTSCIKNSHNLTFADTFSGAGGISVGFRNAGFSKLFSIECNQFASATIRRNFPDSVHFEREIQTIGAEEIRTVLAGRRVDVLVGGPPCQGFSVAGARRIDDPRNELFLEFCRMVEI